MAGGGQATFGAGGFNTTGMYWGMSGITLRVGFKLKTPIHTSVMPGDIFDSEVVIDAITSGPSTIIAESFGAPPTGTLCNQTVGGWVIVSGWGFKPDFPVLLEWDGWGYGTYAPSSIGGGALEGIPNPTADSDGTFSLALRVPSNEDPGSTFGPQTISAGSEVANDYATTVCGVIPSMTTSPAVGPVGTNFTVSGTGFASSGQVTVYLDGVRRLSTFANLDGVFFV